MRIGLFGTGAYGMALSDVLTYNKHEVIMWTKFPEEKELLEINRANEKLLPGFLLNKEISITNNVEECIKNTDMLIIAIPAAYVDSLCQEMQPYIRNNHILIATKGIEQGTGLFMDQLVSKYLNTNNIAIISGPSFASDIITKKPVGLSIAGSNKETILLARRALQNDYIKFRECADIIGMEICGSIKNVIALAAGILDGLGTNDSTKAMFITEAMYDMEEILDAFNCNRRTVDSYAGIGDLLLTCTSNKSRNHTFGKLIGSRPERKEIEDYLNNNTVEGYYTLESIYQLLKDKDVIIPIIDLIYEIVVNGKNPELLLEFLVYK